MVERMLVALILLWLIVGAGCVVGFLLVRQNGRILLRLEGIEARLGQAWKLRRPVSRHCAPANSRVTVRPRPSL